MDRSHAPVFYDCEASGVEGLPIEIGWAVVNTATGDIQSEGHLVKPPRSWDMQAVWDPAAERLHGISLRQLLTDGWQPFDIARRINDRLAGRELFSDSPADEHWLRTIFDEAGPEPLFTIRRTDAGVLMARFATSRGWDVIGYDAAKTKAARISPTTHRAEADARHWAVLWRIIATGRR